MTKTPAELNAEWERIAADLGEGIVTAVERAEADAAANAVKTEREAIAAWLEWFGRETAFPGSFHALAVAVKQGRSGVDTRWDINGVRAIIEMASLTRTRGTGTIDD